MTEDYNPTDNAIAERVNGTLKTEVIYREQRFIGFTDAERRIASFIDFYNEKRPHSSIGMKVPSQADQELGDQRKCWLWLSGGCLPPAARHPPECFSCYFLQTDVNKSSTM